MTDRIYTIDEKIAEIEILIEDFRWARADQTQPENHSYRVLKQIAKEMRAARGAVPSAALVDLSKRMESTIKTKADHGYSIIELQELAWKLIEHWPSVKSALSEPQT